MQSAEDLVTVYHAANAAEAHMVCSLLEGDDIVARVVDGQEPFAGIAAIAASVIVHRRDEARALQAVNEYQQRRLQDESASDGTEEEDTAE